MATTKNAATETKVKAGAAGAGLGAAVAGFVVWLVDAHVHTPGVEGDLPPAVTGLIVAGSAAGVAWLSGWLAKHTPRDA